MYRTLEGQWLFRKEGDKQWLSAAVPGCNFLDLMDNNIIEDPFYGMNEGSCGFVGECGWEYKTTVSISAEELMWDEISLKCEMLDTLCSIYVGDTRVAQTDNCFIGYSIPLKKHLREGDNELRFCFASPVEYIKEIGKKTALAPNANGMNGVSYIRKPQCHFGWDWGPVLIPSGISGKIGLEFDKIAALEDFSLTQTHGSGGVKIEYHCTVREYEKGSLCRMTLIHPDGRQEQCKALQGEFLVTEPELWWTRELSGRDTQPLYTLRAELLSGEEVISSKEKRIGLRTLVLDRALDEHGGNFCFVLNGVPIFAKGANLIPADCFITRFDKQRLSHMVSAAEFSGFNLIRIWGGGYYGSDELYDICDERGILLWQDFAFACQPYPFFDEEFLENVRREIAYNVRRLSHHPSLALWCGNNEIETMSGGWMHLRNYIKWTEKFFYDILEKELRLYDTATSFIPGSPCGAGYGKGINSDNVGDTHLWSVWHGLSSMQEYRKRSTRFCSEFGFESLPDIKTVASFSEKKDYSLDSPVMKNHQKCSSGNGKMFYYIRSRFRLPAKFEDFIYLSQVTQLKCIEDATEHWRRNRGLCNGALYWQFNDCWPVCSWSSYDYYGCYKALQYGARHFNKPLTVSLEDKGDVLKACLINDLKQAEEVKLKLELFDFDKGVLYTEEKELTAKALSVETVFVKSLCELKKRYDKKRTGVALSLYEKGEETARKIYLFGNEKSLCMPAAEISLRAEERDGEIKVTLSSDKYARLLQLTAGDRSTFSDNYFDLLPGETREITVAPEGRLTAKELCSSITAISLTDIPTRKIKISEAIGQIKMLISPVNIGNCVFHRKKVKDVKLP